MTRDETAEIAVAHEAVIDVAAKAKNEDVTENDNSLQNADQDNKIAGKAIPVIPQYHRLMVLRIWKKLF